MSFIKTVEVNGLFYDVYDDDARTNIENIRNVLPADLLVDDDRKLFLINGQGNTLGDGVEIPENIDGLVIRTESGVRMLYLASNGTPVGTGVEIPSGSGGSWSEITEKPFETLGSNFTTTQQGALALQGVAILDRDGKVPASQLPSYVDDVLEYDTRSDFPAIGESGKIYIARDTSRTYRWSGSSYVGIKGDLVLGTTSSTAYRGDYGQDAYEKTRSSRVLPASSPEESPTVKFEGALRSGSDVLDDDDEVYSDQWASLKDIIDGVNDAEGRLDSVSFTEPEERSDLEIGDSAETIFGKISKWLKSLNKVGNYKSVSVEGSQSLTSAEKETARNNIDAIGSGEKGQVGGVATLGTDGKVPSSQLPATHSLDLGTTHNDAGYGDWTKEAYDKTSTLIDFYQDDPGTGPVNIPYVSGEIDIGAGIIDADNNQAADIPSVGALVNKVVGHENPTFTQATNRANISSRESLSTLFGKIMKWFADLGTLAFKNSLNQDEVSDGTTYKRVTATEKQTWDSKQNALTTSQLETVNSGLTSADKTTIDGAIQSDEKGAHNGVATLDETGKIPSSQLPSSVGDVSDVKINNVSIVDNHIASIIYETGLGTDSNNAATVTAIRAFVNSSIASAAAYYLTSTAGGEAFATKAALVAGPYYYDGQVSVPTKNDYAVVIADETHNGQTARYVYTGTQWAFQYTFNMQFTQAQINAINSGITAAKVALYDAHLSNTSNPHSVTKSQVGLGNVGNFKAVSTVSGQNLTTSEKTNARTNIDAGTVTSVAVKMNNEVKGTVTSSGTIDLGTVLTAHQDISGKVSKTGDAMSGNLTVMDDIIIGKDSDNDPCIYIGGEGHLTTEFIRSLWNNGNVISMGTPGSDPISFTSQGNSITLPNAGGTVALTSQIPTVNNAALTLKVGDTTKATFYANDATAKTFQLTKSDITGLGIPGSDTDTHRPIQMNGSEILGNTSATALNLKAGSNMTLSNTNGTVTFTATDTNTAHSHSTGVGLTGSGSSGTSGTYTYKVALASETLDANAALARPSADANRTYPVIPDKNGKLATIVPWANTDTDTHRPIKMNGSQILGSNTTPLDLVAGSNVTLTNSSGVVTIAATNTNSSHNHSAGIGLVGSGSAGTSLGTYAYKADLVSETKDTYAAVSRPTASSTRIYPVIPDKNGKLATIVPWADTNTHRPIKMNGSQILASNTTPLDLVAGSNVSLSNSGGAVTVSATDTTYSDATQSTHGLMSTADKIKLDGVATGATNVTSSTVSDWGFTKNAGTVTSVAVKMNGASKGTVTSSGTIDLGTVLTAHQDISGKVDKATVLSREIDLNTVVTSGFYYVGADAVNLPQWAYVYGQLIVSRVQDTITQIYSSYREDGNLYIRSGNPSQIGGSGSWSEWRSISQKHHHTISKRIQTAGWYRVAEFDNSIPVSTNYLITFWSSYSNLRDTAFSIIVTCQYNTGSLHLLSHGSAGRQATQARLVKINNSYNQSALELYMTASAGNNFLSLTVSPLDGQTMASNGAYTYMKTFSIKEFTTGDATGGTYSSIALDKYEADTLGGYAASSFIKTSGGALTGDLTFSGDRRIDLDPNDEENGTLTTGIVQTGLIRSTNADILFDCEYGSIYLSEIILMRCFRGDTSYITMSDGSKKLLRDIKKGDKVLGYNVETGETCETTVVRNLLTNHSKTDCTTYAFANGATLDVIGPESLVYNISNKGVGLEHKPFTMRTDKLPKNGAANNIDYDFITENGLTTKYLGGKDVFTTEPFDTYQLLTSNRTYFVNGMLAYRTAHSEQTMLTRLGDRVPQAVRELIARVASDSSDYIDDRLETDKLTLDDDELALYNEIKSLRSIISADKEYLNSTDYKAFKFAEGALSDEEWLPVKQRRADCRAEINTTEVELAKLEAEAKEKYDASASRFFLEPDITTKQARWVADMKVRQENEHLFVEWVEQELAEEARKKQEREEKKKKAASQSEEVSAKQTEQEEEKVYEEHQD